MSHYTRYPITLWFRQVPWMPRASSVGLWVGIILCLMIGPSLAIAGADKVDVCHRPPDTPSNAKIKSVSTNALPEHLAHGDTLVGPEVCDGVDNDCNGVVDDPAAAAASCDDSIACTIDTCVAGSCSQQPDDNVCLAGEACTTRLGCLPECPCWGNTIGITTWSQTLNTDECVIEDGPDNFVWVARENVVGGNLRLSVVDDFDLGMTYCDTRDNFPGGAGHVIQEFLTPDEKQACIESLWMIAAADGVDCPF